MVRPRRSFRDANNPRNCVLVLTGFKVPQIINADINSLAQSAREDAAGDTLSPACKETIFLG